MCVSDFGAFSFEFIKGTSTALILLSNPQAYILTSTRHVTVYPNVDPRH